MRLFPKLRCNSANLCQFTATVELQASETEGADPVIHILAATGKPMPRMPGHQFPVILDVASAKFARKVTPIIEEHDTSVRLGYTTSQNIDPTNHTITVSATISGSSQRAKEVAADVRKKFPFQASIGADPQYVSVPEGKTAMVNGTNYRGPITIARNAVIREISLAVLGADSDTATIAASTNYKESNMDFETFVRSLGLDPATLTEDQKAKLTAHHQTTLKAATGTSTGATSTTTTQSTSSQENPPPLPLQATLAVELEAVRKKLRDFYAEEEKRHAALEGMFARHPNLKAVTWDGKQVAMPEFRASAMSGGYDLRDVELALLKGDLQNLGTVAIHTKRGTDEFKTDNTVLECAIVRASGKIPARRKTENGEEYGYEKMYPAAVLEASDKAMPYASLHFLMDRVIEEAGMPTFRGARNSETFVSQFARAHTILQAAQGIGTHSLSNILENVGHKMMVASYQAQTTVWQFITSRHSLNDFKAHAFYKLDGSGGYRQIGPDGELPHLHLTDSKTTIQADTYGQRLTLGRKQLRNDDLGALTDAASWLGLNATVCIEEELMALLLDNRASFIAGGANDMTLAGISAVELVLRDLVDDMKRPILIAPDRVLVGSQDALAAKQIFSQANLMMQGLASTSSASTTFTENPHQGKYMPLASPYLNNTLIKKQSNGLAVSTNQNSTQWFMFMNPAVLSALRIGFLDGNATPTMTSAELPFDSVGGIQFKIIHDWGIAIGDTNGAAYVSGA